MAETWLSRTTLLLGEQNLAKLQNSRVAVLGLGGVGGTAAEALCRSGIGHLLLADHDNAHLTNLNRQILVTRDVLGQYKTEIAKKRFLLLNPDLDLTCHNTFYLPENRDFLLEFHPDYVIDAIDTVTAKLDLIQECQNRKIPLITCLGTGNRLDPSALRIGDLSETAGCGCPLAKVLRRELKKQGIEHQKVLYSTELPVKITAETEHGRHSPASIAFVPPVAGYLLASAAVQDLLQFPSV